MPGYEVKLQRVAVEGGGDLAIRSLLDRRQYSDPLGTAAAAGISPATWSHFGQIWPSARKLADVMQHVALDGRRVLELGCGLALASLVVHRRHGDVTASDCHPLAGAFLTANLLLDRMPLLRYCRGDWDRSNPDLGEFDLIIGSDVLYERNQPAALASFIELHAARRAEVIIVDPNRGNRPAFHRNMAGLGFDHSESMIDSPLQDGDPYRGRLLRYRRDGA